MVTADEVPDPQDLHLWLEIDRHRYQNSTTATMVFGVAYLVCYVSRFMSLHPGDIISTGTPPGIGMGHRLLVYLSPAMRFGSGLTVWASSAIPYLLTTLIPKRFMQICKSRTQLSKRALLSQSATKQ